MNFKECTELITNFLHIKTKKDLDQLFNEADFDKTGRNGEFSYFYYRLLKNKKIINIFETYSKNTLSIYKKNPNHVFISPIPTTTGIERECAISDFALAGTTVGGCCQT